jgi:hypothetical protein
MFSIMDFLPTFSHIVGGKMPTDRPIDGVDQTDVLLGNSMMGYRENLLSFIGADLVSIIRAAPQNLIIPPNPLPRPEGASALAFLQAVYRDTDVPLSARIRCAVECLPFESPKLSATAVMHPGDFAQTLERAILRSGAKMPRTIEAEPVALPQPE